MKYLQEYRDPALIEKLLASIDRQTQRPWTIMEVCGGQTHGFVKNGLIDLLPQKLNVIHGPGCPVCVTDPQKIDTAVALSFAPGCLLATYGDMLRVPGSHLSLQQAKAAGGQVKVFESPLDAVAFAEQNRETTVIFFAVGFETTAPASALALKLARSKSLDNFKILVSHVLVPPVLQTILSGGQSRIDGFLAAGHVCTVSGYEDYLPLSKDYGVPFVVTGFEPVDLLLGVEKLVTLLEAGENQVYNAYGRYVSARGNPHARGLVDEFFETTQEDWRGIGSIAGGGLKLRAGYAHFDASGLLGESVCHSKHQVMETMTGRGKCISGEILMGLRKPWECSEFGKTCTPQSPLGAPMVSSEGACAAYIHNRTNFEVSDDDMSHPS